MKEELTFSKRIVRFLIWNGAGWIWASYYLALKGQTQIAETLSITVCKTVIAVVLAYCCKAFFENLSKHNAWPDKKKKAQETGGESA